MADKHGAARSLNWLEELNAALTVQKEILERWCSCFRHTLSQAKKSTKACKEEEDQKAKGNAKESAEIKNEEEFLSGTKLENFVEKLWKNLLQYKKVKDNKQIGDLNDIVKLQDDVDLDEIDKLLAKAKSVRVLAGSSHKAVAEPSKEGALFAEKPVRNVATSSVTGRQEQRASNVSKQTRSHATAISSKQAKVGGKEASRSMARKASGLARPASRHLSKSKPTAATKTGRREAVNREEDERGSGVLHCEPKSIERKRENPIQQDKKSVLVRESNRDVDLEGSKKCPTDENEATSKVNADIVKICTRIQNLKKRLLFPSDSNQCRKVKQAKEMFLVNLEKTQKESVLPSEQSRCYLAMHDTEFGKMIKRKFQKASPASQALAVLRWEATYNDVKELQNLCDTTLNYLELELELKGKIILYDWASNLMKTESLTRSEKINAYRKLYGLLLDNGKNLPTMIDDSDVYGFDVEDDDEND